MEYVRYHNEVAVRCKLVGDESSVHDATTERISTSDGPASVKEPYSEARQMIRLSHLAQYSHIPTLS